MSDKETVSRLSDNFLGLMQNQAEALVSLRDKIIQERQVSTEESFRYDLDRLFKAAGDELGRVQAEHRRLGEKIRAPNRQLRRVK